MALLIVLGSVIELRAAEPRVYTPYPGVPPDANGDGVSDVDNILRKLDQLAAVGVKFDDKEKDGNIPLRNKADGRYHMACVDLLNVCFRAAGYDIPSAMSGGPLLGYTDPTKQGAGSFRQIDSVVPWLKRNPNFHFYRTPEINLVANTSWRPQVPFMIGDMLFVHYDDAHDRHSGIITGVDAATGLPTHITNCSIYNPNQGLYRTTIPEFFSLKCRMLSGYCRPASWDGASIIDPVKLGPPDPEVFAPKKPNTHSPPQIAARATRRKSPRGERSALPRPLGSPVSRRARASR